MIIYADGGCRGNPGIGAWAYFTGESSDTGFELYTTNNQMELTAVIKALESLDSFDDVEIRTDSQYVVNICNLWRHSWKKNGWKKSDGQPVKNLDLIQKLDSILEGKNIKFTWVKGHSRNIGNDFVDKLLNKTMDKNSP
jgi:ribonuclease HI